MRGEIHHEPWPLFQAEAEIDVNTMTSPVGINLSGEPLLHFAKDIDVLAWGPEKVR